MDVEEKKAVILLNQLKASLNDVGYKKYVPHVENFLQELELNETDLTSLDLSAALLQLLSTSNGSNLFICPKLTTPLPERQKEVWRICRQGTRNSVKEAIQEESPIREVLVLKIKHDKICIVL